ncbi:unnamed protein product [Urochloa humidicola]
MVLTCRTVCCNKRRHLASTEDVIVLDTHQLQDVYSHGTLEQLVQETGDQMRCKLGDFNAPVLSECDELSVFDGTSARVVVWDEISADLPVHEGLLQQLAQGPVEEMHQGRGDLTGKEKMLTADFSHVSVQLAANWVEEQMTSMAKLSESDAQKGCDGVPSKVVWGGEEIAAEHKNLLQQLASGEWYPDDGQFVDGSPGSIEFGLIDADHVFVQELDDNKVVWDDDFQHSHDKLPATWDDELPADFALQGELLKQLTPRMECTDAKKSNQVVKLDTCQPSAASTHQECSSILLLPSNQSSDSFGDFDSLELHMPKAQIGKSCFTSIVHLINGWSPYLPPSDEIKTLLVFLEQSMEANISLYWSPFSTNILQKLSEKFCQNNLLTDIGSSLLSLDSDPDDNESNRLEEPVWGTAKGGKRGTNLLADITANDTFEDLPNGQQLNCVNRNLTIREGTQGVKGLQLGYAELQSWNHSDFSPGNYNSEMDHPMLEKMPLGKHSGFNLGICQQQPALYITALRQWDPGIMKFMEVTSEITGL